MSQNIDELVPTFILRRRKGHSYRQIGLDLGVDSRTVKSRVKKAEDDGDFEHWAKVRQQADLKSLEEHRSLLSQVCRGVERGISFNPLTSQQDPEVLLKGVVESGLDYAFESMATRGIDLESPTITSSVGTMVKPPKERLAQKLLAGLMQHEPELESLLEGWKESWEEVDKERRLRVEQGRNLYRQHPVDGDLIEAMAWATTHEALGKALDLPGLGYLEREERPEGSAAILRVEGTRRDEVVVGTELVIEQVWAAKEQVLSQLIHPARIETIKRFYKDLLEKVAEIADQLDLIILRGRPDGICNLCESTGVTPIKPKGRVR